MPDAIDNGCMHTGGNHGKRKGSGCRFAIYLVLQIVVFGIASLPTFCYVLATNTAANDNGGWWVTLLSNPLVVAIVKIGFSNLFIPWSANILANFRLSAGNTLHTSENIIELNKMKVASSLATDLVSKIVAPIMIIFWLDDNCLRSPTSASYMHDILAGCSHKKYHLNCVMIELVIG